MRIERRNTTSGQSPYAGIDFRLTTSEIKNPDGSVVFRLENVEIPKAWSQVASDVLAQKYFRKAGVAARLKKVEEETVPSWLWRSVPDTDALATLPENERIVGEHSSNQCSIASPAAGPIGAGRAATSPAKKTRPPSMTSCATSSRCRWSRRTRRNGSTPGCTGPMASTAPARAIITSTGRPASSPSRNPPTSTRSRTPASSRASVTTSSTRAASWTSGCARRACSNMARAPAPTSRALRGEGEKLSGGGRSSGLMSFLKIGDRAAGAIKSGGTTRRAAKMVVVDVDHPDIETYIDWKVKEEQKVAALVTGSKINQKHLKAVMKACVNCEGSGDDCFDPEKNPALRREIKLARRAHGARQLHQAGDPVRASRATRTSSSRSTTPTGIRKPTSRSPARTPTTRCR